MPNSNHNILFSTKNNVSNTDPVNPDKVDFYLSLISNALSGTTGGALLGSSFGIVGGLLGGIVGGIITGFSGDQNSLKRKDNGKLKLSH